MIQLNKILLITVATLLLSQEVTAYQKNMQLDPSKVLLAINAGSTAGFKSKLGLEFSGVSLFFNLFRTSSSIKEPRAPTSQSSPRSKTVDSSIPRIKTSTRMKDGLLMEILPTVYQSSSLAAMSSFFTSLMYFILYFPIYMFLPFLDFYSYPQNETLPYCFGR